MMLRKYSVASTILHFLFCTIPVHHVPLKEQILVERIWILKEEAFNNDNYKP
jgi:hypothetical protein